MAESKSLKKAVKTEVKEAVQEAKTGETRKAPETPGDLPTGAHSRRP